MTAWPGWSAWRTWWVQAALVLLCAGLVYFPSLGERPLDFSEGHRAIPGWTMLVTGDPWRVQMFEQAYFRKPPGMPWAIAATSSVLGQTPLAARSVSAIAGVLAALAAFWFARRWFGDPVGLAAGLCQACMPLMWNPGRSAEIEMLNQLGTVLAALGIIDLLLVGPSPALMRTALDAGDGAGRGQGWWGGIEQAIGRLGAGVIAATAGLVVMALAKGPASLPAVVGAVVGVCVASRGPGQSWIRPLGSWRLWLTVGVWAALLTPVVVQLYASSTGASVVREDPTKYSWSRDKLVGVLTLVPIALGSAMPATLGLVGALWRRTGPRTDERVWRIGRALVVAWGVGMLVLVAAGISNPRYAMPVQVFLPMLIAYSARRLIDADVALPASWRVAIFRRRVFWAAVVTASAITLAGTAVAVLRPAGDSYAGLEAAKVLGKGVEGGATVWADDAIEARPDVLWQMQYPLPGFGPRVRGMWKKPALVAGETPPAGSYLLLRTDRFSGEWARYKPLVDAGRLKVMSEAQVREYRFALVRVEQSADKHSSGEAQPVGDAQPSVESQPSVENQPAR